MDAYTITNATLYNALQRGGGAPLDGTYELFPCWTSWSPGQRAERYWSAEPLTETEGYEVALRAATGPWAEDTLSWAEGMRLGVWTDSAGVTAIDRTIHVKGSLSDAMAVAAQFGQLAIWSWEESRSLYVAEYQRSATEGI
jgi:hypothetical protein